jgi:predicted anti-sigma-YlaC factor YlaD
MTAPTRALTCREVSDFLGAYVAGELAAVQHALFDEHLAVCPDCRTYLRQYETTGDLCRGAFDDDALAAGVPESLVEAILAARSASTPEKPRRRR